MNKSDDKITAPMPNKSVSLFNKYFKFFSGTFLICLTLLSLTLMIFIADYWEDQKKLDLYNAASNVAAFCSNSTENSESEEYGDTLKTAINNIAGVSGADILIVSSQPDNAYVKYCGCADKGESETVCKRHSKMKIPGEIITSMLVEDQFTNIGTLSGTLKNNHFVASSKILDKKGNITAVVIAIQQLSDGLKPYLSSFIKTFTVAIVISLFTVSIGVYIAAYSLTKPMKQIAEATRHFSDGDFSYRIKIHQGKKSVREIDELQYAFNSMADALEDLEKSRSSFIANVSHELKTPMTTIGGFIDGIIDGTIDGEHRAYYLKIVSDEVKRLSRLVVSMLNMSKIESGELTLNISKFNISDMLLKIFLSFERQIDAKKISVEGLVKLGSMSIEADPDMINQVFYNLVDNAVKFTDYGGTISVKTETDGEYFTAYLKNTGKGISPEDLERIFDRFYKADKSRSLDAKSAGLGLFIVKSIVELHDGKIYADSVQNEFTQFTVKLKVRLIQ